jgi:hypothetical protein
MTRESRMLAGVLLVVLPTVMLAGLSLLSFLMRDAPGYMDNPLVMLRYVDEALLAPFWKWLARTGAPIAAILIPAGFLLSVASPSATKPNAILKSANVFSSPSVTFGQ